MRQPQLGEPERSSHVVPNVQDASLVERDTPVRNLSRTQQATGPAAVGDYQRDTGPSR